LPPNTTPNIYLFFICTPFPIPYRVTKNREKNSPTIPVPRSAVAGACAGAFGGAAAVLPAIILPRCVRNPALSLGVCVAAILRAELDVLVGVRLLTLRGAGFFHGPTCDANQRALCNAVYTLGWILVLVSALVLRVTLQRLAPLVRALAGTADDSGADGPIRFAGDNDDNDDGDDDVAAPPRSESRLADSPPEAAGSVALAALTRALVIAMALLATAFLIFFHFREAAGRFFFASDKIVSRIFLGIIAAHAFCAALAVAVIRQASFPRIRGAGFDMLPSTDML
jgi:hypothetical protein